MGAIPRTGPDGLITVLQSGKATSGLVNSITNILHISSITKIIRLFASVCMLTSFLGVSLAFTDFVSDGFKIKKDKPGKWKIYAITFIPPLLVVTFFPGIFIIALSYAGIITIALLVILPALMVWRGRYVKKINRGYRVFGGKFFILLTFFIAILIVILRLLELFGIIKI